MEKIKGFKAFNKGLITRQGNKLELYKLYEIKEEPLFMSRGYHMCKCIEDTLRYFDCNDIDICEVEGYPKYEEYIDEYAGSEEMYSCQKILLTKLLTKEEIIEEAKQMNMFRFAKFLLFYPLTLEQQKYFMEKYINDNWILSKLIYRFLDNEIYKKTSENNIDLQELARQFIKK